MTDKHKNANPVPAPESEADAPALRVVEPALNEPAPVPAAPVTISSEDLEQLKAAAARADENWDKFLRTAADLDNYRKRVARERDELVRSTSERVVSALLPVLDNLERALDAADKDAGSGKPEALLTGLKQTQTQFRRALEQFGLQEVAATAGHPFDPNHHEAISHVESAEHPEGAIIDQLQRGYKLADRLLRPARVIVSKGQPGEAPKGGKKDSPPTKQ